MLEDCLTVTGTREREREEHSVVAEGPEQEIENAKTMRLAAGFDDLLARLLA